MLPKYVKLTFVKDKPWAYVIVKNCKRKKYNGVYFYSGYLIYGSKREYNDAGTWFGYGKVEEVEELDEEWVVRNHFAGLL